MPAALSRISHPTPAAPADGLGLPLLEALIDEHRRRTLPRLQRLWRYYRNPLEPACGGADGRPLLPAQAEGLPPRLQPPGTPGNPGSPESSDHPALRRQRERVIENDIAWRVHALVDFMFGRPLTLRSTAGDAGASPERVAELQRFLHAVLDRQGGVTFLQDLGLLGAVYGFVDVVVRVDAPAGPQPVDDPLAAAGRITLEIVEPTRAVPLQNPDDYRELDAYAAHWRRQTHDLAPPTFLSRVCGRVPRRDGSPLQRRVAERTEVWTADEHLVLESSPDALGRPRRRVMLREPNRLGRVPVVHIQNLPQPFAYEGLSEVKPLIPLQDELNTRLSDRANRITFQCFKMYLGKRIGGFLDRPVGPGQMWSTDDVEASIQEFGGDAANPSESEHIAEVREAMDKMSGVTPLAAGVLRDRIGNLTSENALRVTMMGLLAKTQKKRVAYGNGLARLCELILHAADAHNLFPNAPEERTVRLDWPDPLPASESQQLQNAQLKLALGVPRDQLLAELGYADCVH